MRINIEQPNLKSTKSQHWKKVVTEPQFFTEFIKTSNSDNYFNWVKFKRHQPQPKIAGYNLEEIWLAITELRKNLNEKTIVKDKNGEYYSLYKLTKGEQILHELDLLAGRQIFTSDLSINSQLKSSLKQSGLMEEAIASSMLEGAHTTRKAAKTLLIEHRQPKNRAETMIVNNYAAMNTIETKYKKQQINQKELFDLHLLLTKNDPEIDKSERGRYRLDSDEIFVGNLDNNIAYTPPNARFLKQEMPKFFTYINDTDETSRRYIHPVIKAIIIHFWFAILHPFTDGNGRLARCLFYWYLIKHGYEAISFIPISTVILKSPSQYANAYLYSEQDNLNMTYFYDYQLNKIKQAITDFNNYISKQINNNYTWENKLKNTNLQNNRQVKALSYLLASKAQYITIASYINLTGVKRITASKDIAFLTKQNWLEPKKEGKTNLYYPTQKLIKFGV